MLKTIATLILCTVLAAPAFALEPVDWRKNFAGLNGIVARCILSTDRNYAKRICEQLASRTGKLAEVAGVSFDYRGQYGTEDKDRAPASKTISAPLYADYYVRGTGGQTAGASIRISVYAYYRNAVEQGQAQGAPRTGRLVMWEESLVSSGPARQLPPVMAKVMARKFRALVTLFADNGDKATRK